MKKIILVLASMLWYVTTQAIIVKVTKENAGTNGYNYVYEEHNCNSGSSTHTLTCKNPGYELCAWLEHPNCNGKIVFGTGNEQYVVLDVANATESYAQQGNYKGRTILPGGVVYVWTYIPDSKKFDFTIYSGTDATLLLTNN